MYKEKIINIETGEVIWRDYSENEVAEMLQNEAKKEAELLLAKELEAEINTRKAALLEKLGITEEEAKLLFG